MPGPGSRSPRSGDNGGVKPLDRRLLRHARSTRGFLALSVLLGLGTAGLIISQAVLLGDSIDGVFYRGATLRTLAVPLALLAGVMVARAAVSWGQEAAAAATSARVKSELRAALLARSVALGPQWLSGQRAGELATLATRGIDALDGYFSRYLPQLVLAFLVPVAVLVQIVTLDWLSALTILLTLPLIPIFMVLIGLQTRRVMDRQWCLLGLLSSHFLDVVAGLPTLKVFGRAKAQAETIRTVTGQYRKATMKTLRVAFLSSLALELIATVAVALVAVSVGLRLVDGDLTLRTALIVLILAPEAYLPLRAVGAQFHASAEGLTAAGRVFEVLETALPAPGGAEPAPDLRTAEIRLDGVVVRYAGRGVPALDGLDLTVAPGERIAMIGPSGCGKSTALSVLLGFLPPSGGRVTVGGVDLGGLDVESLRAQITWVPQRPYLFAGTVADNIRIARATATDDDVRCAAREAGAEGFVDSLPNGFGTRLGDGGSGLSAGQRQRLALARAFLRDTPMLLLDEPTANLDGDTEVEVRTAIRRLSRNRTVLLVAHRPALLELADRVVDVTEASHPAGQPAEVPA